MRSARIPNERRWFTHLCALSPIVLLLAFLTMALHVRLGFGYWPDQVVEDFPAFHFVIHECVFVGVMLFAVFAGVHLIVRLIHAPCSGGQPRRTVILALLHVSGWVMLFLVVENVPAKFVTWFTD